MRLDPSQYAPPPCGICSRPGCVPDLHETPCVTCGGADCTVFFCYAPTPRPRPRLDALRCRVLSARWRWLMWRPFVYWNWPYRLSCRGYRPITAGLLAQHCLRIRHRRGPCLAKIDDRGRARLTEFDPEKGGRGDRA